MKCIPKVIYLTSGMHFIIVLTPKVSYGRKLQIIRNHFRSIRQDLMPYLWSYERIILILLFLNTDNVTSNTPTQL